MQSTGSLSFSSLSPILEPIQETSTRTNTRTHASLKARTNTRIRLHLPTLPLPPSRPWRTTSTRAASSSASTRCAPPKAPPLRKRLPSESAFPPKAPSLSLPSFCSAAAPAAALTDRIRSCRCSYPLHLLLLLLLPTAPAPAAAPTHCARRRTAGPPRDVTRDTRGPGRQHAARPARTAGARGPGRVYGRVCGRGLYPVGWSLYPVVNARCSN
jgi:hypothetical protein